MTQAQRDALAVLAANPSQWVRGGKRASGTMGLPNVNTRAADGLVDQGLADMRLMPHVTATSCPWEYRATVEGIAAHTA